MLHSHARAAALVLLAASPHGLWARNYREMLDQIKSVGVNTIRLPFATQMFDPGAAPGSAELNLNPGLRGLTSIQVMDKVVEYAGQIGLRILLGRHSMDAGILSPLWYSKPVSSSRMPAARPSTAGSPSGPSTATGRSPISGAAR